MFGKPSLRRRLILSYLVVVMAVTAAAFVTVQILVPQFFEQAVQERLDPGPQNEQNQQRGQDSSSGQGGSQQDRTTTTTAAPGEGSQTTTTLPETTTSAPETTTSTGPNPTGSTTGPGGGDGEPGSGSEDPGNGSGEPGGNTDPGQGGNGSTTTTIEAYAGLVPGVLAAPLAQEVEQSPVPIEIKEDYDRALTAALVVATVIGLVIALALGTLLTRRMLHAVTGIKEGAGKLADGHYSVRVPVPAEVELADLAESVNTLADSLERTEQTRARLVSDLAHEIRNPLSTIEGYMEGLIDGVLPPSQETYQAVAAEAHRLKRLTWDLSTLSKAQEGAIEFDFIEADLAQVVEQVAETLGPQYEINDVKLILDVATPLRVRLDFDRMAQTLTNLLGNALSHTPPGGTVRVVGTVDDHWCSVAVVDSGEGIPAAQLETIFERFTRLDGDHPGTGIGLNIARTLARAHGGDIHASSEGPGLGATFELTLPRLAH